MAFLNCALSRAARLLLAAGLVAPAVSLGAYPDKPITLVVPFSAGGPTDKIAATSPRLHKPMGQTVIVDNTAGADAARRVRAPAGGYTLLSPSAWPAPALYKNLATERPAQVSRFDQRSSVDADRQTRRSRHKLRRVAQIHRSSGGRSTSPTPASARHRTCSLLLQTR
jgi:tripartite-type tricarboxylate transporter receptor subunit TctC